MEDLAAIARGLCDAREQEKCEAEFGVANLAWACEKCEKKRTDDLSLYTLKLLRVAALADAGYPLAANDLTLDEWFDLGKLKAWRETYQPST